MRLPACLLVCLFACGGRALDASGLSASPDAGGEGGAAVAPSPFVGLLRVDNDLCLPEALPADAQGRVGCRLIYVLASTGACGAWGLGTAPQGVVAEVIEIEPQAVALPICELAQIGGACGDASEPGWCYVSGRAAGACPQKIVVSPPGVPPVGALALLACGQ